MSPSWITISNPSISTRPALDTPALALANAARETLRIGDAMEQMLESLHKVMHGEPRQEKELRRMADDINVLYTAIKPLSGANAKG
ncbi:Sodium-dependent phosphate transporter [Klebsiella pneumoniae]|nr:Sodium-dependent phosphate transporter [Klebsiella pneumoniae]